MILSICVCIYLCPAGPQKLGESLACPEPGQAIGCLDLRHPYCAGNLVWSDLDLSKGTNERKGKTDYCVLESLRDLASLHGSAITDIDDG